MRLDFEVPDHDRFPCLGLAFRALRAGGSMPAVLNAANEVAVAAFLDGALTFPGIAETIAAVMDAHAPAALGALEDVLAADRWAREQAALLLPRGAPAR